MAGGELNVCLDGMVVDLGSLPNGGTAADSESRLFAARARPHVHAHIHITGKEKWAKRPSHRGTYTSVCIAVNFSVCGRKQKKNKLSERIFFQTLTVNQLSIRNLILSNQLVAIKLNIFT